MADRIGRQRAEEAAAGELQQDVARLRRDRGGGRAHRGDAAGQGRSTSATGTTPREFLQAAALRAGNPITVAGIPVGEVTSMKLAGDHVEAGLKVRNDVVAGQGLQSDHQGHHHPGFAVPGAGARRPGLAARQHVRPRAHRGALRPAGGVGRRHHHLRTGRLRQVRPVACASSASSSGAARGACRRRWRTSDPVDDHRRPPRPTRARCCKTHRDRSATRCAASSRTSAA